MAHLQSLGRSLESVEVAVVDLNREVAQFKSQTSPASINARVAEISDKRVNPLIDEINKLKTENESIVQEFNRTLKENRTLALQT